MRISKLFLCGFLLLMGVQSSAGANPCLNPILDSIAGRRHELSSLVQDSRQNLQKHSDEITRQLLKLQAGGHETVLDFVGVGAGPEMGVFAANLKAIHPDSKTLVFEATGELGTFNRLEDFNLNSVEVMGFSGNQFPGVAVQPSDFNLDGKVFMPAKNVGDATVLAYDQAQANVLFHEKVVSVQEKKISDSWPARYRIQTDQGITVYAHKVGLATGLGNPHIRLDAESMDLILNHPNITNVDQLIVKSKSDPAWAKGRDVVVVGSGDGSAIAREALSLQSPEVRLSDRPKSLTMVGSEKKRKTIVAETLDYFRYAGKRKKALAMTGTKEVTGRLEKVRKLPNGKLELHLTSAEGNQVIQTDQLVLATGYRSPVDQILQDLGSDLLVQKPFEKNGQVLAHQIVSDSGKEHEIYVFGAAMNLKLNELPKKELLHQGVTLSYLNVYGERSAKLPEALFPLGSGEGKRFSAGNVKTLSLPPVKSLNWANESSESLTLRLKLELGKVLGGVEVRGMKTFDLRMSADGVWSFHQFGLNASDSDAFSKLMARDPVLLELAQELTGRNHQGIRIQAPFREGSLQLHRLKIIP
jgi:hypothetical protein